jgi:diguanylate cyclase (GGDEF)-like protein/PAS domain S-box-containing protein
VGWTDVCLPPTWVSGALPPRSCKLSSRTHDTLIRAAQRVSLLFALATAAIGAGTLLGWTFGIALVSRLAPSSVAMAPNTAIALLLLGGALAAHAAPPRRRGLALAARAAGWAAAALVTAVALQWIFGVDLRIDQLLFTDRSGQPWPGRPGPITCLGVLTLATAMEFDRRLAIDGRVVNVVVALPLVLGVLSLTGYASGITAFSGLGGALRLAPATAVALVVAGFALLLARPQRGIVRLAVSPGPGGLVARRLLPVAIALPLALELGRLEAVNVGLITQRVGDWLFAFLTMTITAAIILRLGRGLDLLDLGRRSAEERLRHSEALACSVTESANDAIVTADARGSITLFNPGAERLFGWQASEVLGRPVSLLMPARYRDAHRAGIARMADGAALALAGQTLELHGLTNSGREFDLELSLARVDQGSGSQVTAIMRDISPRKLLEQLAQDETDRLDRVVAAQAAIVAGAGELAATLQLVAAEAREVVGGDGAVVELPDRADMVYRAAVGAAEPFLGARVPLAGSLAGIAMVTAETQHCTDSETDERVDREACRRVGVRSMICVPLCHDAETVGVLKVFSAEAHAFGERDERTLELVGGLAAATVHRAQAERRLAAHHAAAEALAGAHSLEAGLAGALRGIGEQLGWGLGAVWLSDPDGGALTCAETWHHPALPAGPYLELCGKSEAPGSGGLLDTVRRTVAPAWFEQVDVAPEQSPDPPRATAARASGLQTLAAVPIVSRGETLGVVELGCRVPRTHDAATLELITDVASQIGQFVQRRRAEERMAVQAANLAAVAELSQRLSQTREASATRPALCRSIRDLTRADQVALVEPDGHGRLVVTGEAGGLVPLGTTVDLETDTAVVIDVFRAGQGRFVADFDAEATKAQALQHSSQLRSAHYEPLVRDGEVTGVLFISTRDLRTRDAGGIGALMRLLSAEAASALAFSDLLAALHTRARTDELTGLANRRTWEHELPRELSRAMRTGQPVSMAILDLDHFKAYNDTYGHPAGDRLLRSAAAAWTERLRTTDLIARYGGEEFAVLLPGCDAAAAATVAEALRSAVPDDSTCSIGIATWDGHETGDELVGRADTALYAAKGAGRDRAVAAP